jgi:hypothetical protein
MLSQDEAAYLTNVFDFMLAHKEDRRDRWSYDDEYIIAKK